MQAHWLGMRVYTARKIASCGRGSRFARGHFGAACGQKAHERARMRLQVLSLLNAEGLSPDIVDLDGQSAVHLAAMRGQEEVVRALPLRARAAASWHADSNQSGSTCKSWDETK